MTEEEKSRLKDKIIDEIASLEQNITALEEVTRPVPPDDAIGRLTRMEAINAKSINEASLRSAKVKLTKLKRALFQCGFDTGIAWCYTTVVSPTRV